VSEDPRYYFPQPQEYYRLENQDCKDQGSRIADATNPGCFEVQIEGDCGVRQVASMTANSITISGAPCAWGEEAQVHVPWMGIAPDIGALEFGSVDSPAKPDLTEPDPAPFPGDCLINPAPGQTIFNACYNMLGYTKPFTSREKRDIKACQAVCK
jgi:hypothetical protein